MLFDPEALPASARQTEPIPEKLNIFNWGEFNVLQYGVATEDPSAACIPSNGAHFGSLQNRTSPNCLRIMEARDRAIRYALFVHKIVGGHTGDGKPFSPPACATRGLMIRLDEEIASVANQANNANGSTSTDQEWLEYQAGRFMHELGHTLGLRHGGGDDTNEVLSRVVFEIPSQAATFLTPSSNRTPATTSAMS